eukprot:scaffold50261_cov41-Prasinocladus_malaysianus.AAC.1
MLGFRRERSPGIGSDISYLHTVDHTILVSLSMEVSAQLGTLRVNLACPMASPEEPSDLPSSHVGDRSIIGSEALAVDRIVETAQKYHSLQPGRPDDVQVGATIFSVGHT